jgi:transcription-repair coupling factor (superfamily II helicase)
MSAKRSAAVRAWATATGKPRREAALLAGFDNGFFVSGQKPLVVITSTDVLGSRAHHPQPMARSWTSGLDAADMA